MAGTKRRGKGEGSVFYHKAASGWVARLPGLPDDPGGWKPKEQRFATRAEAEKAFILWGTFCDEGTAFSSAKFTLESYRRLWLAEKKNGLRPKTEQDYRRTLELHVFPFLGATKLAQLSTQRVRTFRSAFQEAGRSGSLVRRADLYLRMSLTAAVNEGLISHNHAGGCPPSASPNRQASSGPSMRPARTSKPPKARAGRSSQAWRWRQDSAEARWSL